MQIVFEMRYSYFGQSGWQSRASKDPKLLFDPERLKRRAHYFEKIALASLVSQTDQDFKLVLLSSQGLPEAHKEYLVEKCNEVLGPERAHVIFRAPNSAGRCFRHYLRTHLNQSAYTAQIVLDDDDAVSSDFVSMMRREALAVQNMFENEEDYCFLSFPKGFSIILSDMQWKLCHREVPFTNLGLALIGRTQTKRNPFMVAHKRLARKHPARVIYSQKPYYVRVVHDTNDSRAMHGNNQVTAAELPKVIPRFPFLSELLPEAQIE